MQKGVLRTIDYGSDLYQKEVELRFEILRKPLGLTFSADFLEKEKEDWHLGYIDQENQLVACLLLSPQAATTVKMRQVAVATSAQGRGIGSALVGYAESFAMANGFESMVLHARVTAVPFYLRLGYSIVGDLFEEVGIPHHKMTKQLRT